MWCWGKLWRSSLYNFLHPPVTSSLLRHNYVLVALFSRILSLNVAKYINLNTSWLKDLKLCDDGILIKLLRFRTLLIILFLFKTWRFGDLILFPSSGLNKNRTMDNIQKNKIDVHTSYLHNYIDRNRSSKTGGKYIWGEHIEKYKFINIAIL
jgi:hypothetical protein